MFLLKHINGLFHFHPMLLQSNNPQNPPKNKLTNKQTKLENTLESLKQLSPGHKKQPFDFFGERKVILGEKRLTGCSQYSLGLIVSVSWFI